MKYEGENVINVTFGGAAANKEAPPPANDASGPQPEEPVVLTLPTNKESALEPTARERESRAAPPPAQPEKPTIPTVPTKEERAVARASHVLTHEELYRLHYHDLVPRMDALASAIAMEGGRHAKLEQAHVQALGKYSQLRNERRVYQERLWKDETMSQDERKELHRRIDEITERFLESAREVDETDRALEAQTTRMQELTTQRENTYLRLISDPRYQAPQS